MSKEMNDRSVQELKLLWHSWTRFSRPSDENSVDCDELAVITAQLLQPNPDIPEINHMLKYLLTKIVGLPLFEIQDQELDRFAHQLHSWRKAQPQKGIELPDQ
jgi:hypothetical protein